MRSVTTVRALLRGLLIGVWYSCLYVQSGLASDLDILAVAATPTFADMPYADTHFKQKMDIYLPTCGSQPFPVVVWIHGGGWRTGSKSSVSDRVTALHAAGLAVVSINYRLSFEDTFPAQLHDCKAAIRWLHANGAMFGLDPNRIGLWGPSAGGHLAALLGTSSDIPELEGEVGDHLEFSSRVHAVVDFAGPTDILFMKEMATEPPGIDPDPDLPDSSESKLIGWDQDGQGLLDIKSNLNNPNAPYPSLLMLLNMANPIVHVSTGMPSFFIAHGDLDARVPILQSTLLWAELVSHENDVEYHIIPGIGHDFLGEEVHQFAVDFLRSKLCPETVVESVPTVSQWGLAIITFSMLIAGTVLLQHTRFSRIVFNRN